VGILATTGEVVRPLIADLLDCGHHAIINYFVLGDQVVMMPLLLESEPVRATSEKSKGIVILQLEQNEGLEMLRALPGAQRQQAELSATKVWVQSPSWL